MFKKGVVPSQGLRIIIVGCGKVGRTLVEQLGKEGHDITIVDKNRERISQVSNIYDVMGIVGNGASYKILQEAGIDDADLIIAVTGSDELNLLCCTIATQVGNCAAIARVRTPEYSQEAKYLRDKLGLALIINPELEAAIEMAHILHLPSSLEVTNFAHGQAQLIKYEIPEGSILDGTKLMDLGTRHHANILIGTQMISKGLDFEDVTLVVVLNADQGLRFPDYRSYEKTFSMVSQVAGRAGRGVNRGSVIVQTIEKDNEIFEYIKNNDYEGLYETEIRARRDFGYPPFGTIVRIVTGSTSIERAANTAEKVKDAINFYSGKKGAEFTPLGPTPCIIQRIEKKYRWQLFYKIHGDREISLLKNIINFILSEKRSIIIDEDTSVSVDVNPKNMM